MERRKDKFTGGNELIFGVRAIMEAITSGKEFDRLYIQRKSGSELIQELVELANNHRIPMQFVPVEKLNRLTRKNHQGAVAFISPIAFASLDHIIEEAFNKGEMPLLVLLDQVTDVRNTGAIARSAYGAGAHALVIGSKNQAPINGDAIKTSAGALNHLPVVRIQNLAKTIKNLQEFGITVVGASEKAPLPYFSTDMSRPLAIVVGSEEYGLSDEVLKACDDLIQIPMTGKVNSLNVSVACGVLVFEAVRQRHK